MKNKTKTAISLIILVTIVLIGFIYYSRTHISIWGFNISKNELKDVLMDTRDNNYIITNPQLVLELTQEVSKMKKLYKVEPSNFPPEKTLTSYRSLMIQTKNNYTYGGSFWKDGNNGIMLDSNGYYWSVSSELFKIMDKSLKEAQKLN